MRLIISSLFTFFPSSGPSATLERKEVCYGQDLTLPMHIQLNIGERLYFTPSNGGKTKLLIENDKVNHLLLFWCRLGIIVHADGDVVK